MSPRWPCRPLVCFSGPAVCRAVYRGMPESAHLREQKETRSTCAEMRLNMKLTLNGIQTHRAAYEKAGYRLPCFDYEAVKKNT